jgi:hypothetical protein
MTTSLVAPQVQEGLFGTSLRQQVDQVIDGVLTVLPDPKQLTAEQRRGIIARYTAVLEGNFIYWMTATYLSSMSEEAHPILLDNLREEVGDCHPAMLRKFAIEADAFPTDKDALDVHDDLTKVRLFLGRMGGVQNLLTMAFFESYIQRFMSYLAELAKLQGSTEMEYTDVHGVCDVAHSEGLFQATAAEMVINPPEPAANLFEGVDLLRTLLQRINRIDGNTVAA